MRVLERLRAACLKMLLFTLFTVPIFRVFFSFIFFFLWHYFCRSWDSAEIIPFCFSDGSSGQSNSLATFPLPPDEHQEGPLEESIPVPNLPVEDFIPHLPLGDFIPVPNNLPLDVVDQFRLQNLDTELELIARIRLLESRLIDGLPPQLNFGEYETLVRGFIRETLTIAHYSTTISNELFDISIFELKADLVEHLFNVLMRETIDRLNQILTESPFPEHAIRTEALEFIVDSLDQLRLTDPRSNLDKVALTGTLRYWLQDLQLKGHQSTFYRGFLDHFKGSI